MNESNESKLFYGQELVFDEEKLAYSEEVIVCLECDGENTVRFISEDDPREER